ncbi:unnamed protein product [Pylaiella littoralis]
MCGMEDDETENEITLPEALRSSGEVRYGFNNQYTGIFRNLREELADMTEIQHPDSILSQFRSVLRISCENQLFDPERYLGDCQDGESDPIYQEAMSYLTFHTQQWDVWKARKAASKALTISDTKQSIDVSTPSTAAISATTTDPNTITAATTTAETISSIPTPQSTNTIDPRDQAFESVGGFSDSEREILSSKLPNKGISDQREIHRGICLIIRLSRYSLCVLL